LDTCLNYPTCIVPYECYPNAEHRHISDTAIHLIIEVYVLHVNPYFLWNLYLYTILLGVRLSSLKAKSPHEKIRKILTGKVNNFFLCLRNICFCQLLYGRYRIEKSPKYIIPLVAANVIEHGLNLGVDNGRIRFEKS
jgi:hypothetical protein